jgi:hypothetical protein
MRKGRRRSRSIDASLLFEAVIADRREPLLAIPNDLLRVVGRGSVDDEDQGPMEGSPEVSSIAFSFINAISCAIFLFIWWSLEMAIEKWIRISRMKRMPTRNRNDGG